MWAGGPGAHGHGKDRLSSGTSRAARLGGSNDSLFLRLEGVKGPHRASGLWQMQLLLSTTQYVQRQACCPEGQWVHLCPEFCWQVQQGSSQSITLATRERVVCVCGVVCEYDHVWCVLYV